MTKKTYNLSNIMKKAWADAKAFVDAISKNFISEEVHTWYGWKELGYEVIHESKNVFQITVSDPNTKSGTRVLSYFTKSQVVPWGTQD